MSNNRQQDNKQKEMEQMFLQASLYMSEKSIKKVLNFACNRLIRLIFNPDIPFQKLNKIYGGNLSDVKSKLRRYFIGKSPSDEFDISFFELQETTSTVNMGLFANYPLYKDARNVRDFVSEFIQYDINELNHETLAAIAGSDKAINYTMFLDEVKYDYDCITKFNDTVRNYFSQPQFANFIKENFIDDLLYIESLKMAEHINYVSGMIIAAFRFILSDLQKRRNELYLLLAPFIKAGLSSANTIRLMDESPLITQELLIDNKPIIIFNHIGFSFA